MAAVLPHLARLGTVLNRSRLVEQALEQAGGDLDRPSISILTTLSQAGEPLRIGEIATRMRLAGPHVTRQGARARATGARAQDRSTFYHLRGRFADDLTAHFATDDPVS